MGAGHITHASADSEDSAAGGFVGRKQRNFATIIHKIIAVWVAAIVDLDGRIDHWSKRKHCNRYPYNGYQSRHGSASHG